MSYVQLLYHAVIRTKSSEPTLSLEHSDDLYRYIWGVMKAKNCVLYRINGMEDHIHILFSLHPTIALSDFMRDLKAETSKMLIRYIKNQREHHNMVSFREEYITF